MKKNYPITALDLGDQETLAIQKVLSSGWIMQGPEVEAFEREFSCYTGASHACAVSNGTSALHLALMAAGVRPGHEVITVSHSFIATANAVLHCGAIPVFVDIEPATFNMDPRRLESMISEKTGAILCVHQMGLPCNLAAILAAARARHVPVVEDAACAIGSEVNWNGEWQKIGRPHGLLAAFSFHPRKVLTTGEGGMVTTNDPELDHRVRLGRQHGFDAASVKTDRAGGGEGYLTTGFNYRMTDLQAALGRVQLQSLPEAIRRRRMLAEVYSRLFMEDGAVTPPREPEWARTNWQSYCVRLPGGVAQKSVMAELQTLGIATRRGIMCAHRETAYADKPWLCEGPRPECSCAPGKCAALHESELAQDQSLCLPLYPRLTVEDVELIAQKVIQVVHQGLRTHS
jgi:perosamine synthetase